MARKHKNMVKLARSMRTHEELINHTELFKTRAWLLQKWHIKRRVAKIEATRKAHAMRRRRQKRELTMPTVEVIG